MEEDGQHAPRAGRDLLKWCLACFFFLVVVLVVVFLVFFFLVVVYLIFCLELKKEQSAEDGVQAPRDGRDLVCFCLRSLYGDKSSSEGVDNMVAKWF